MSAEPHESHAAKLWSTPLRDLGLKIEGTPLEPILAAFRDELARRGITRVRPAFYLSTEWGVPWGSVSSAIPFYLARPELTDLHATYHGHVEGTSPADVLRYLRHEMGHVVNYAYRLYEEPEWVRLFGDINRAYVEEYRPRPFHPDYVVHLPGWYAQKHPDEDWAETFAVWMTPGLDWRAGYARRPAALAKLEYCDRTMARLRDVDPPVTAEDADEDVGGLGLSLEQFYRDLSAPVGPAPPGLDDALQTIFEAPAGAAEARPAAALVRRLERTLMADVYRWTGYFPERTRSLLRQLAARAEERKLSYPADRELQVAVGLSAFVTALVMNQASESRQ
jgi:hypothetical protein